MFQTVTSADFHDAFRVYGRTNNFSPAGRDALFEYLEEMEDDCGEPIELDVIALCCDYSEYSSIVEAAEQSGWEKPAQYIEESAEEGFCTEPESEEDYAERCEEEAREWLTDRTSIIEFDDGVIIANF